MWSLSIETICMLNNVIDVCSVDKCLCSGGYCSGLIVARVYIIVQRDYYYNNYCLLAVVIVI